MRSRCRNPNIKIYKYYGGKGVRVCERWENSFGNFYEDMGERPDGMLIDRIDVNGDYCPENCRWVTVAESSRNRNNTVKIKWKGRTQCMKDWADELGINYLTMCWRIKKGWTVERAFSTFVKNV